MSQKGRLDEDLTKFGPDRERRLTAVEFQHLVRVPAAVEWFANIDTPASVAPIKMTLRLLQFGRAYCGG